MYMVAGGPQSPSVAGMPRAPMPADMQQGLQHAQTAQPGQNGQVPEQTLWQQTGMPEATSGLLQDHPSLRELI